MSNEIGEISQVINTTVRGIEISVRVTKEILSMLKRLIEILEAATFRRGLSKTSGKTLASTLKMKGNVFSAKMTDDMYKEFGSFLKHKGKKYGIQWADGPTLEKGFHRVFIAEGDAQLYKMFLEDYAKKHCKSKEEKENVSKESNLEDLYTYMEKSGLKDCPEEEYEKAQEEVNGKDWKDRIDKPEQLEGEKKNLIEEGMQKSKQKELEESGKYQFIRFSPKRNLLKWTEETKELVIADPKADNVLQLTFKPDFLFNNGKDIVAVISNEKIIDVKNMVNGEKMCLSAKEYMKKREVLAIMAKSIYDIKEPVQMPVIKNLPAPEVINITISKQLLLKEKDNEESRKYYKTRVPGMYGENKGFIWIKKENAKEINNGKTIATFLNKKERYNVYSSKGDVLMQMTGEELFSKYYAKVNNKNSQYTRINGSLQENTFKIKSRKTAKM